MMLFKKIEENQILGKRIE